MRFEMKNATLNLDVVEIKEGVKREASLDGSIDLTVEMTTDEFIQIVKEEGEIIKQLLQMFKK